MRSRPAHDHIRAALVRLGRAGRRGHVSLLAELLEAAYERVEAVEVAVLVVARLPRPSVREHAQQVDKALLADEYSMTDVPIQEWTGAVRRSTRLSGRGR